jgi:predicted metal-dependent hydrolase
MRTKRRTRLRTAEELKAAVRSWAARVKARPRQIRIQRMARKWASCSRKGRVTFSSELFRQPYRFQEFVIVHELLHLKIPNHGKLFKSLLKAYLPRRCYGIRGKGKRARAILPPTF